MLSAICEHHAKILKMKNTKVMLEGKVKSAMLQHIDCWQSFELVYSESKSWLCICMTSPGQMLSNWVNDTWPRRKKCTFHTAHSKCRHQTLQHRKWNCSASAAQLLLKIQTASNSSYTTITWPAIRSGLIWFHFGLPDFSLAEESESKVRLLMAGAAESHKLFCHFFFSVFRVDVRG